METDQTNNCGHCGCGEHGTNPCKSEGCYCGHEGHWTVPYLKEYYEQKNETPGD